MAQGAPVIQGQVTSLVHSPAVSLPRNNFNAKHLQALASKVNFVSMPGAMVHPPQWSAIIPHSPMVLAPVHSGTAAAASVAVLINESQELPQPLSPAATSGERQPSAPALPSAAAAAQPSAAAQIASAVAGASSADAVIDLTDDTSSIYTHIDLTDDIGGSRRERCDG